MKALNRQQLERWEKTGFKVGKIDGDITDSEVRKAVLQNSQIVVVTPDVMHAFLLGRLNDNIVGNVIQDFIKNISLIIIDELHLFKGVFGTNSAYLFRRFNNIRRLLRKDKDFAQYITASATLPNAVEHSFNITGVTGFEEIGIQQDASPMAEKIFYFIEQDDVNADVVNLMYDFLLWMMPRALRLWKEDNGQGNWLTNWNKWFRIMKQIQAYIHIVQGTKQNLSIL